MKLATERTYLLEGTRQPTDTKDALFPSFKSTKQILARLEEIGENTAEIAAKMAIAPKVAAFEVVQGLAEAATEQLNINPGESKKDHSQPRHRAVLVDAATPLLKAQPRPGVEYVTIPVSDAFFNSYGTMFHDQAKKFHVKNTPEGQSRSQGSVLSDIFDGMKADRGHKRSEYQPLPGAVSSSKKDEGHSSNVSYQNSFTL